ncbi:dCTP deaminase/dUTPase family protein [Natronobiforma cellulositropha]|uniref:dCTP deaminase n=1 Tax=Natronobiforma cellulositropha TaxID=1679076 RepID=UPI0021D56E5D|nr:dCTP deaminase [Natronobiforma cellulositropha]
MSPEDSLLECVDNVLYEPTQVHDHGIDLTVSAVYDVSEPGRLDFGGDELEDAGLEPRETTLRNPDDEYGWWDLSAGQYVFQHNEFLTDTTEPLLVQPRNELLARGGSHPTVRVFGHLPLFPLTVADGGLRIKENARISTLVSLTD